MLIEIETFHNILKSQISSILIQELILKFHSVLNISQKLYIFFTEKTGIVGDCKNSYHILDFRHFNFSY